MTSNEIELEIGGEAVAVPRGLLQALAAAAAERAGVSSQHRDLSLVLGRALEEEGRVRLERGDARALRAVLEEQRDGFGEARAALLRAATSG